jgi:hypothetical protein
LTTPGCMIFPRRLRLLPSSDEPERLGAKKSFQR